MIYVFSIPFGSGQYYTVQTNEEARRNHVCVGLELTFDFQNINRNNGMHLTQHLDSCIP